MQHSPLSPVLFGLFCVAAAAGFAYWQRRWQRKGWSPEADGGSECPTDHRGTRDDRGAAPAPTDTIRLLRAIVLVLAHTSVVFIAPCIVLTSSKLDPALRNQAAGCVGLLVTMLVIGIVYSRRRDWG